MAIKKITLTQNKQHYQVYMKIYTHEDIDARVIVDHAISNIVADAKKTFGSSSDMSLYD